MKDMYRFNASKTLLKNCLQNVVMIGLAATFCVLMLKSSFDHIDGAYILSGSK